MDKQKERFGEFVRRKRVARDLSQREMAQRLGVSGTYLSKIEHDEYLPPKDTIEAIAKVIRCDPSELLAMTKDWIRQEPKLFRRIEDTYSKYSNWNPYTGS